MHKEDKFFRFTLAQEVQVRRRPVTALRHYTENPCFRDVATSHVYFTNFEYLPAFKRVIDGTLLSNLTLEYCDRS
jgi:hypothetical protein